jgi:hypothetical protein
MAIRILSLVALSLLSGCASSSLYWGPALSTCSGTGSAAQFASGSCRIGAEYDVARKKTKHSLTETEARTHADQSSSER